MSPVSQVIRCKLSNNNYLQLLADVCRMICRGNHWLGLPYSCRRRSIAKTMPLITRQIVPTFSAVANHSQTKIVNHVRRWPPERLDSLRDVQNRLWRLPSMPSSQVGILNRVDSEPNSELVCDVCEAVFRVEDDWIALVRFCVVLIWLDWVVHFIFCFKVTAAFAVGVGISSETWH